jgi:hypothetical protein
MPSPNPIAGSCSQTTTGTFSAVGSAPGSSKYEAFQRAFAQAQTLLDSFVANLVSCPAECPDMTLDVEPDYTASPPAYAPSPDAADVLVCTVQVSRVVNVTCAQAPSDG